jgi:hypothetical protein
MGAKYAPFIFQKLALQVIRYARLRWNYRLSSAYLDDSFSSFGSEARVRTAPNRVVALYYCLVFLVNEAKIRPHQPND